MNQRFNFASIAKSTGHNILTWEWTKKLLHWLIISAGTVSECAFLIASLWMSVNASVHPLVLLFIDDPTSQHLTEFATAAYVALPELILGLAFVVTIGHARLWLYNRKDYSAAIWAVLYGLPTLIFLVLSLITLGCSVTSVSFRLPEPLIVVRALAGYMFAFTSLLYTQLGVPQEKDRLQKKDDLFLALRQEKDRFIDTLRRDNQINLATLCREKDTIITELNETIRREKEELKEQKELLTESKNVQRELLNAVNKSSESALQGYSEECMNWLKSGQKTVLIEEIARYTGHSKRKIANAITAGMIQTAPRNKELILVSSLMEWLKKIPAPVTKEEQNTDELMILNIESIRGERAS